MVVTRFTDAIGEADLPVEKYAANTNEISLLIKGIMQEDFKMYGLDLTNFLIENISMPDEIKTEIFELSRLNTIDLDKFAKIKAAKAMEKAAENESGTAGAGMGMGMGFAMANQMGQSFSQQQPASGPPPIPNQIAFFAVVNGQQAGPFDMPNLQQMISQQQLNRDTLVWKQGMSNWTAAGQVSEFSNLFGNVPPPLPPQ
jgi:hypothetical protein